MSFRNFRTFDAARRSHEISQREIIDAGSADLSSAASVPTADAVLSVARAAATEAGRHMIARRGAAVETTKLKRRDARRKAGECQEIISRHVRDAFPEHALLGEEDIPPGPEAAARRSTKCCKTSGCGSSIRSTARRILRVIYRCRSSVSASRRVARRRAPSSSIRGATSSTRRGAAAATLNGEPARVADARTLEEAVICAPCPNNPSAMVPAIRSIEALMPRARSLRVLGSGV